jgi:hypothetical protein
MTFTKLIFSTYQPNPTGSGTGVRTIVLTLSPGME